ncbi:MAG: carbohydrate binding domain-containing protein [Armatimonadetes bacterium]|nr:carbohydrate binding domain-containing protein [Armatimonadota bacterium]
MEVRWWMVVIWAFIAGMGGWWSMRYGQTQEGSFKSPLFPFVLPWDDASPSVTNISHWLHKPAGKFGHIRIGANGHLYAGNRRIRFLGVNLCFGACFPRKEDAEKIAARMAKFGINIVRFHHMDMFQFPSGIRARNVAHTRDLDPEALDRLDYLISQLKRNGVYVNLNLLVSRPFNAADGLPKEIEQLGWKERHIVGFFYKPMIELQKEYARKLLTHRNKYTGLTYAEDPAIAFVEINNENGLIHAWLGNDIDNMPKVFQDELQRQWNEWLKARYGTTEKLRKAWGVREEPLGEELLRNTNFVAGLQNWVLERHAGAEADAEVVAEPIPELKGVRFVRITVKKRGQAGWHVQFNQPNLKVHADKPYTLSFWARAEQPCNISVGISQAHEPWQNLGFSADVRLTQEWQEYRFTFTLSRGDENARVVFSNLGAQTTTYWLAAPSLRSGGVVGLAANESIEDATVPIFLRSRFGERTSEAQKDWMRFLWEIENQYWQTIYRYLKDELKVRALVIGTIVGCSTPNMMAQLDCVDTHAYWQHPMFPSRPWDPEDWIVPNRTMVNERGGTLPGLALRRVLGKPFGVTEYNHPAPNTYSSEAFLLLAAYAAFQDWDAIYAFSYSHRLDDWDTRRIPNFFDIDQHPTKMVTLPPAAAIFVRGDVKPAKQQVVVRLTKEQEADLLRRSWAWLLVHAGHVGVRDETMLIHKVAIATEGKRIPPTALKPEQVKIEGSRFVSDTNELVWNLTEKGRGVVTVNAQNSKAVIGFGGGKKFELGSVTIEPGQTMQDGWCAITVTAMEGNLPTRPLSRVLRPVRLLITATGYAENADIGWKEVPGYPPKSSCGRNWGRPPSLVEGIPAKITLPFPAKQVQGWALDEKGQRKEQIPVTADPNGNAMIQIGPQWRTLWYEIEVK